MQQKHINLTRLVSSERLSQRDETEIDIHEETRQEISQTLFSLYNICYIQYDLKNLHPHKTV